MTGLVLHLYQNWKGENYRKDFCLKISVILCTLNLASFRIFHASELGRYYKGV